MIAIRALLETNTSELGPLRPAEDRKLATDRITIRLRPGDRRAIDARADRRGFKSSSYVAALVRAHVSRNPPLPEREIALLKQGILVLTRLGRFMAAMTREEREMGSSLSDLAKQLIQTRNVLAAMEQVTHDLVKAALIAWESKYD